MADIDATMTPAAEDGRKYARLGVRIRAAMYDSMIFVIALVVTLSLAISLESGMASPVVGIAGALFFLLYEPVMVWAKGGTLGHIACNLRVVDDRTLGNPSFWRATLRFVVKAVLGWFSFLTMMASRRLRAVHDVLSGSTVQVRDSGHIRNYDFAPAYSELVDGKMPSRFLRVVAILIYSVLSAIVLILIAGVLEEFKLLSSQCLDSDRCSYIEELIFALVGFAWLASLFVIVFFGWRGRLFGFRRR